MIYILNGEERFLINKEVLLIAKNNKVLKEEIVSFNADKDSLQSIYEESITIPFLSDKKIITVNKCEYFNSGSCDEKLLLNLLNDCLEDNIVIFIVDNPKLDSRKKIVKEFSAKAKCKTFNGISENDKRSIITKYIKDNNININIDSLEYLITYICDDLYSMFNELNKLALYNDVIDNSVIQQLITKDINSDIFELATLCIRNDKKRSLELWDNLKSSNNEVIALIGLLASQFRFMYKVKYLRNKNLTNEAIASELGAHPFRIKKTLELINRIDIEKLLQYLYLLSETDIAIKSGVQEKNLAFELFLIKLA